MPCRSEGPLVQRDRRDAGELQTQTIVEIATDALPRASRHIEDFLLQPFAFRDVAGRNRDPSAVLVSCNTHEERSGLIGYSNQGWGDCLRGERRSPRTAGVIDPTRPHYLRKSSSSADFARASSAVSFAT